jgi:hypothetical protein
MKHIQQHVPVFEAMNAVFPEDGQLGGNYVGERFPECLYIFVSGG